MCPPCCENQPVWALGARWPGGLTATAPPHSPNRAFFHHWAHSPHPQTVRIKTMPTAMSEGRLSLKRDRHRSRILCSPPPPISNPRVLTIWSTDRTYFLGGVFEVTPGMLWNEINPSSHWLHLTHACTACSKDVVSWAAGAQNSTWEVIWGGAGQ